MSGNIDLSNFSPPSNGITGGYTGNNVNILRAMIAFSAIAWYNCAELIFLICLRFKRWRGLYFWSLMATSWAIVLYQIGSWGKMRNIVDVPAAMTVITNVGWIAMITGNSLVLYSRLHLLCQNQTLLKCVLYGIIANTICMYIPTTALDVGSNVVHPGNPTYVNGYSIMERIQMTMFTVQEFLISGIYLLEAYRYLKVAYAGDKRSRNVMYELLAVNVTIIILDIALLAVAHRDLFQIEVTLKGLVYSVKLKLELGVLSRLVRIVTNNGSALNRTLTFDNDLANLSDEPKPFSGLDFCTSPLPEKSDPTIKTRSSDSTSHHQENISPGTRAPSVPWLMTNTRSILVESPRLPPPHPSSRVIRHPVRRPKSHPYHPSSSDRQYARRNTHDSNRSPLRPPPVQRPTQHTIQRGESYANSEFLTSAAVTEGANDETLRQFQLEIEAELGMGMGMGTGEKGVQRVVQGSLPSSGEGSEVTLAGQGGEGDKEGEEEGRVDVQAGSEVAREQERKVKGLRGEGHGVGEEDEDEDEEEEWARDLGVLGPERPERPVLSRESSLGRMYPGRITGENG
ncbi:hypothetical protein C1H76_1104 [Elsinoe australis]|uniref:DUF7703 domain-containing protein n=1 Tax=Elsinoe australis TaxID=40998 RepID=A0A4V6DV82_9PEZI|nr:hypothetical protein C1H76_1104 [Elsinoe australis]